MAILELPNVKGVGHIAVCYDRNESCWYVMDGSDEEELRGAIIEEGYSPEHSFIVRIPLPTVPESADMRKSIKVVQMKETEIVQ